MASALDQLTNSYNTSQPVSFDDYYAAYGKDKYGDSFNPVNPNGFLGKFHNFWTGDVTSARQQYENYLAGYEYKQNQVATAAANKEKYVREDSEIQRRMKDYKAAGLNPYLLLTSGSAGAATSSASEYAKYKRSSSKEQQSKDASRLVGTAIRAIALIAMLAG